MSESNRGPLPPKLYFRIGEVASLVGVEPHVLRYWEREFRSIRPSKSAKGQRVYSRRDVENLLRVRDLLYAEGFTIAGAKKKLMRTGLEPREAREREREEEARAAVQAAEAPAIAPAPTTPTQLREQLVELRSEVAAFLEELGGSG
jgi:DNA-binding transcriptional MerR regulator